MRWLPQPVYTEGPYSLCALHLVHKPKMFASKLLARTQEPPPEVAVRHFRIGMPEYYAPTMRVWVAVQV